MESLGVRLLAGGLCVWGVARRDSSIPRHAVRLLFVWGF